MSNIRPSRNHHQPAESDNPGMQGSPQGHHQSRGRHILKSLSVTSRHDTGNSSKHRQELTLSSEIAQGYGQEDERMGSREQDQRQPDPEIVNLENLAAGKG